jgi:hypothetical protein
MIINKLNLINVLEDDITDILTNEVIGINKYGSILIGYVNYDDNHGWEIIGENEEMYNLAYVLDISELLIPISELN